MNLPKALTGADAHIVGCHGCGLAHHAEPDTHKMVCRRCGLALHFRKPDSLNRTTRNRPTSGLQQASLENHL